MKGLYAYNQYKDFIGDYLNSGERTWGLKSKISKAMGIHSAYLSQVINGEKHLSLEQAEKFARYAGFSEDESNYWILLCNENRAGTIELKELFRKQRSEIQKKGDSVSQKLGKKEQLGVEAESVYFSSWIFAAVYMSLSIPGRNDVDGLSQHLKLSRNQVLKALERLVNIGMVTRTGDQFNLTKKWIRLGKESPFLRQHHLNLRSKVNDHIMTEFEKDIHYSSYITISKKDFQVVKDLFLDSLKKTQSVVEKSEEETLIGLALDIFEF